MSWIEVIRFENATGKLKGIYEKIKGPNNQIDNVLSIHSLRPHTLVGHMSLYKNVLHHTHNTFPNWFLEFAGTYVSFLNRCDYCYEHHFAGMTRFLDDENLAEKYKIAIENDEVKTVLDEAKTALIAYAKKLTLSPYLLTEDDVLKLKQLGVNDGEILEINQVTAYFNYANRTVLGLGVNTNGEVLGLSPSNKEDEAAWGHQ